MTLFANSGVAWPRYESETKEAGKKTFEAASGLFRILAVLEGEVQSPQISEFELTRCAESLDQAARVYARVGETLAEETVKWLTPSEYELAGLPRYSRRFVEDDYYVSPFLYRGEVSIGDLYRDLSHRLTRLAAAIRNLRVEGPNVDLAPQVFDVLRLWETVSTLARLIATLGRRSPTATG